MDEEDFDAMIVGLRDVADYRKGARDGFVTNVPGGGEGFAIKETPEAADPNPTP